MMIAYCLVGIPRKGRWQGEWNIIGSLTTQSLYMTIEAAEEALSNAVRILSAAGDPDVTPEAVQIAEVKINTNAPAGKQRTVYNLTR